MRALWLEYRARKDPALRDRLIVTYAPLVKYVAGRLGSGLPAHVDDEDLVSYGLLGLISAIERYEPDRDVKFETYAIARIRGAIIDELRALDWVPRSVRSRAREIERAIGELEGKLGRVPSDEEIAAKLGITTEELDESLSEISRSSTSATETGGALGTATVAPPDCAPLRGTPRTSDAATARMAIADPAAKRRTRTDERCMTKFRS